LEKTPEEPGESITSGMVTSAAGVRFRTQVVNYMAPIHTRGILETTK
jgi:hypothetical protein